jgi:hypothetical protein
MTVLILFASVCALAAAGYLYVVFSNHALKQKLTTPMHWLFGVNACFVVGVVLYVVLLRKSGLGYIFVEFLLVLGVIWILALYPFLIWIAADWAKRTGRSAKRWGFGAAIGLYLLVFLDQIPTFLLHHYYCATEAGVWVYKTPEQWKAENPGVAETLEWKDMPDEFRNETHSWFVLNERFYWVKTGIENQFFPVRRWIHTIVDTKNNEVVLKKIYIGSGYPGSEWNIRNALIGCELCQPDYKKFGEYRLMFEEMGRHVK